MSAGPAADRRFRPADGSPRAADWTGLADPDQGVERAYRDEAARLGRYFSRRVPANDVRDFVQETFRRLIGHRPDRPGAFLTRIATNLLLERHRAAARRSDAMHVPFDDGMLVGPDPTRHLEHRDAVARIDAALLRLKPKTRDIFLLHRIEGMSYAEIGERLGMSTKGVEKQIAKALLHVRRRVGDL